MNEALLVVDMHRHCGWWFDELDKYDDEKRTTAVNVRAAIDRFRKEGKTVIFVLFTPWIPDGQSKQLSISEIPVDVPDYMRPKRWHQVCVACHHPGDYLPNFLGHRHYPFEPVFFKNRSDATTNRHLVGYLHDNHIDTTSVVGCSRPACITDTGVGLLGEGFGVKFLRGCLFPNLPDEAKEREWMEEIKSNFTGPRRERLIVGMA